MAVDTDHGREWDAVNEPIAAGGRLWAWWLYRVPGRDRLVLVAGLTVRLAGVIMLGYVLPLVWAHLSHPGWSLLLAAGLAVEGLAVVGWWVVRHRPVRAALWADLPTGVAALLAGIALTQHSAVAGWTMFAYPYVLLISFGCGLTCRTVAGALGCGGLWAVVAVAGLLLFRPAPAGYLLLITPTFLVNPVVGWAVARLLRQASDELDGARSLAVRETADLQAAVQRAELAAALHDRILQTLETLGRAGALRDPALGTRAAEQAAWLRRYLETGHADQSDDLAAGLEAVARAAHETGLAVEVNDAGLRDLDPTGGLDTAQRDALVEAAYQTISAFGAATGEIVVRAAPDGGGILISVLSTGRGMPNAHDIADARTRLASAGGRLTVEAIPYAELWVPRQAAPPPATPG
jgi:hypothetical protein